MYKKAWPRPVGYIGMTGWVLVELWAIQRILQRELGSRYPEEAKLNTLSRTKRTLMLLASIFSGVYSQLPPALAAARFHPDSWRPYIITTVLINGLSFPTESAYVTLNTRCFNRCTSKLTQSIRRLQSQFATLLEEKRSAFTSAHHKQRRDLLININNSFHQQTTPTATLAQLSTILLSQREQKLTSPSNWQRLKSCLSTASGKLMTITQWTIALGLQAALGELARNEIELATDSNTAGVLLGFPAAAVGLMLTGKVVTAASKNLLNLTKSIFFCKNKPFLSMQIKPYLTLFSTTLLVSIGALAMQAEFYMWDGYFDDERLNQSIQVDSIVAESLILLFAGLAVIDGIIKECLIQHNRGFIRDMMLFDKALEKIIYLIRGSS
jgi:hypothetical protein